MEDVVNMAVGVSDGGGANPTVALNTMRTVLKDKNVQRKDEFKRETFVWYINKNHPVFVGLDLHNKGKITGHAVVCSGYRLSDESLYFHDSMDLTNDKFIPYEKFVKHSFFDHFGAYAEINYIFIYP